MIFWLKKKTKFEARPRTKKRIYLDYAAATPMLEAARRSMEPYLSEIYGNPGGIHKEGVEAKRALEDFRKRVARVIQVQESGVVFTSGGTESNNLAIVGVVEACLENGRSYDSLSIVTTKLEHPATLRTVDNLKKKGVNIKYVSVKEDGRVDLVSLRELITPDVVLVTFAYVNSEVGVVNDCRDIRRLLDELHTKNAHKVLFHVDGAQAPLWLPCELSRIGADLLSLDGGKCGGGKGVGALIMGKGVTIEPVLRGGGQEMGLRPGTEPVHLISAFTVALEEAQKNWQSRSEAVSAVRDYAIDKLLKCINRSVLNGPTGGHRVANNVHISIPGIDAEFAVITLDTHGVAASTKSACSSKGGGASVVVLAMTGDELRAKSTLRFTLGPETTTSDIDIMVDILQKYTSGVFNN